MVDYSKNAIGLSTKNAKWTNTAFNFYVGEIGSLYDGANEVFQNIVEKAYAEKDPLIASFNFSPSYYMGYPMKEELLPKPEKDEMLQMLIKALKFKTYHALVIKIEDHLDPNNDKAGDGWISWGAEVFVGRVSKWLELNKPNVKLLIGYSDEFVKKYSPVAMPVWIKNYDTYVIQNSPLVGSYPHGDEKPRHYAGTWKFWEYCNKPGLVLFNGDNAAMRKYLGYGVATPPITDPNDETEDPVKVGELEKKLDLVLANQKIIIEGISEIKNYLSAFISIKKV
jgi:hypothetical protein